MSTHNDEDDERREAEKRDENIQRWRGEVTANLEHVKENVRSIARSQGKLVDKIEQHERDVDKRFRDLELKVQQMTTRLAIYTGFAAFMGSGLMSLIVALLLRK